MRRSVVRVRVFGLVLGMRAVMEPNNARGSDASRAVVIQYPGIYKRLPIQRVIQSMSAVRAAPLTNNLHTLVRHHISKTRNDRARQLGSS